ncbi:MAG TPA: hypothetical protein VGG64_04605 [Pirellulales bacterium]|jgi:hypothetical protein
MAHYVLQTNRNGSDWKDATTTLFKNRRRDKHGKPTAQQEFDARRSQGLYARMIRWDKGNPTIADETDPAPE